MRTRTVFVAVSLISLASAADITPEAACGPAFHEFTPPVPEPSHARQTISIDEILSAGAVVEGIVEWKRPWAASGVENEIGLRVTKVLRGAGIGALISIHVGGGYAGGYNNEGKPVCIDNDLFDGGRIRIGSSYLVTL